MSVPVICILGRKGSGKTRLIEKLVRDLTLKGFKVSVFKHIHHPDFNIDIKGKDTWRFMQAGATNVIGISRAKLFVVRKLNDYPNISKLISEFKPASDVILLEGFKYNLGRSKEVHKVITARNEKEAMEIMKEISEPIIGIYLHDQPTKLKLAISYSELIDEITKLISKS